MALTRKMLKAMGIEEEKIDEIISAHRETVDPIIEERDRYKADADKLPGITKERDDLKTAAEKGGENPYKQQFEALSREFDEYKAAQTAKETKALKTSAYSELLKKAGVADKHVKAVLRVSDVDKLELDNDGNIKDADALEKNIQSEWSDFIPTVTTQGVNTANPPTNVGGRKMTLAEIDAIEDTAERQAAIAANHELFGF